jgi:cobalt-zinc-cadmium efflux system protein
MSLAAIELATRFEARNGREGGHRSSHTFGLYRLEVLAAFVNALLLFGVALWILTLTSEMEAVAR